MQGAIVAFLHMESTVDVPHAKNKLNLVTFYFVCVEEDKNN